MAESGELFAIEPKKDCPHIQGVVAMIQSLHVDVKQPCETCANVGENWLCLSCSAVYCSRYVNSHMVAHNEESNHPVALSFSDLSVWCYGCDSYIASPVLTSIREKASLSSQQTHTKDKDQISNVDQTTMKDEKGVSCRKFATESKLPNKELVSRMLGTLYGNCVGDAIGLLTEFMTKEEAHKIYATKKKMLLFGLAKRTVEIDHDNLKLEYNKKNDDFHRSRWRVGDWTDDSDQMILILRTLASNNGEPNILDFAERFRVWGKYGYKELGDMGANGIGRTTLGVIMNSDFLTDPHKCASLEWERSGRWAAPNGGVMRTSVLGLKDFSDIDKVIHNTVQFCKVTHADPRCVASCVAVTTAIALMLQGEMEGDVEGIVEKAFFYASQQLETEEQKDELRRYLFAKSLADLDLAEHKMIGYTYKCLGAGFWAFRQTDFRAALTAIAMEAGDADTNGAVAGALLGCKLGVDGLPESWLNGLLHKEWLDKEIAAYLKMLGVASSE